MPPVPLLLPDLSRADQINQITKGYGRIALDHVEAGWSPFLLVLKFHHLGGRRNAVLDQMHRAAEGAYAQLCHRLWRNYRAPSRYPLLPVWILVPDYPVGKTAKLSARSALREDLPNGGLHLQGVAVLPPHSRLAEPLDAHFAAAKARYCPRGGPLHSVTATPITDDLPYVNRYNFKALPRGRASFDEVLLLPPSSVELGRAAHPDSRPHPAREPWQPPVFARS